jgi:hypothetical protein
MTEHVSRLWEAIVQQLAKTLVADLQKWRSAAERLEMESQSLREQQEATVELFLDLLQALDENHPLWGRIEDQLFTAHEHAARFPRS